MRRKNKKQKGGYFSWKDIKRNIKWKDIKRKINKKKIQIARYILNKKLKKKQVGGTARPLDWRHSYYNRPFNAWST